jgi:hypothetical protein
MKMLRHKQMLLELRLQRFLLQRLHLRLIRCRLQQGQMQRQGRQLQHQVIHLLGRY